jgi:hypothetical protein
MSYEEGKALADSLGAKILFVTEDFRVIDGLT